MSAKKTVAKSDCQSKSFSKDDFSSDQDVRWCPGCGDYAVLTSVQRLLPSLGVPPENYVFISGIGCSSRFPYYMNTYGFHTIHGRAPAIASGVKLARPDLSVWMITGDGDALSIGGNHILHLLRRNIDIKLLLFNNQIYGLTKGQYSPTSALGKVTKSTPQGSLDTPLNPLLIALGAQAGFIARTLDVEAKHMEEVFREANLHRGTTFVEILQNCNIFNDGAWEHVSDRTQRAENQLKLEVGKPLVYGKDNDKGLNLSGPEPVIVDLSAIAAEQRSGELAIAAGVSVHNPESIDLAFKLIRLSYPEFPVPLGVIYFSNRLTYDQIQTANAERIKAKAKVQPAVLTDCNQRLNALFRDTETWEVV